MSDPRQAAAHHPDGTAATVMPAPVERIPLYHWRPGHRLLMVGSRDLAGFDDDPVRAEAQTFQRPLDPAILSAVMRKTGVDGCCLAWNPTLRHPLAVEQVIAARPQALVVATAPWGDHGLCDRLLDAADAWVLMLAQPHGPLTREIMTRARHLEVVLAVSAAVPPRETGLDIEELARLPWGGVRALHLALRHGASPAMDLEEVRGRLGAMVGPVPVYDHAHAHSDCARCGMRLVWRAGGRSRLDGLDPADGRCRGCGLISGIHGGAGHGAAGITAGDRARPGS